MKEWGLSGSGGFLSSGWPCWKWSIRCHVMSLSTAIWIPPLSVYKMNVSSTHLTILFYISCSLMTSPQAGSSMAVVVEQMHLQLLNPVWAFERSHEDRGKIKSGSYTNFAHQVWKKAISQICNLIGQSGGYVDPTCRDEQDDLQSKSGSGFATIHVVHLSEVSSVRSISYLVSQKKVRWKQGA